MIDLNEVQPIGAASGTSIPSFTEVAETLNERIADLAQELLGEPNAALSTRSQLRFGRKGSVAIELDGEKRGQWFDHENGVGGDAMALVCNELGLANGAACAWAVDWLGLDSGNAIRVVSPMLQPAADQQGKAAGGDDTARVAKVAAIVGECSDPATTPAELYLRNRGITATPLPPSLRYRPNAHGRYGALVALATDANGNVNAVQQIYVSDDGGKAPVKVQKRTNKGRDDWSDTSAVRLPGEPPIILCEGVETALSVWQATGQESWACLGISNIARAPVSEGAAVIVARDGDAPGSKAEIQLRHAVTILRQRGCQVAVAEPPTGKDFNDVLVEGGEDAVRDLIAAAVNADLYSTEWRAGLLRNSEGAPRAILANAIHALREAPEWQDVLWHNEFATSTVARRPPPWAQRAADWVDTPRGATATITWSPSGCSSRASWCRPRSRVRRSRRSPATRRFIRCANTSTRSAGTAGRASIPG